VFITNVLPSLPDESGAVSSRFEILKLSNSWAGREDPAVEDALREELPAILLWALDGYDRLRSNGGRFTQPAAATGSKELLSSASAPHREFIEEFCEIDPTFEVLKDDFRSIYNSYLESQGARTQAQNRVGIALNALGFEGGRRQVDGKREQYYIGLRLKQGVGIASFTPGLFD
jgi:putative DNA primase/helicase